MVYSALYDTIEEKWIIVLLGENGNPDSISRLVKPYSYNNVDQILIIIWAFNLIDEEELLSGRYVIIPIEDDEVMFTEAFRVTRVWSHLV